MMKIFVQLNSNVLKKTIGVVASAFGHEMIDTIDLADAIITTDIRMMLSCLKQGKRVVQFIVSPSDEPASGLMTSYPEL
ncbi:MAG TPA: hypothetical protein VLG69_03210, partial [Candidatus Andersenbacteria bacterium]|nr:hypothetical protein [Candidatus Andersenbacteria bacterium]